MSSPHKARKPGPFLDRRRAGVLLHPTSLPGSTSNGDLGAEAYRFVDLLQHCGMSVWQTLPLGPAHADFSPYQCQSVHAGDPRLISRDIVQEWGWLGRDAATSREQWLAQARAGFMRNSDPAILDAFIAGQTHWLDDYALYQALRREQADRPWWQWPVTLRDREPAALAQARARLTDAIAQVCFEQYVFFRQWQDLRRYAAQRDILLFGDMPIFIAHDSADVWAQRQYFALDEDGQPCAVAGVPPDYFSETGQRWGNPLYQWQEMQADGFLWWRERMRTQLELFDLVRIDHFRGFESYWEIPAHESTAVAGRWVTAPGDALFKALHREFGLLPLVAEDLGLITAEVHALRERFSVPGMRVLQFAFDGGADNPYLPHRHEIDSVVYTGTHDNDTTLAWYETLPEKTRSYIMDYLGQPRDAMPWPLVRAAFASVAVLAIVPMQDVLALGSGHRMNTPGTTTGNWRWRFSWDQLSAHTTETLRHMAKLYGREIKT